MNNLKKAVRIYLAEHDKTYEQIATEIQESTGKYCDKSLICNALAGRKPFPWLIDALKEVVGG